MFELIENRLLAYADDSTLLAVVRKRVVRKTQHIIRNQNSLKWIIGSEYISFTT